MRQTVVANSASGKLCSPVTNSPEFTGIRQAARGRNHKNGSIFKPALNMFDGGDLVAVSGEQQKAANATLIAIRKHIGGNGDVCSFFLTEKTCTAHGGA